MIWLTSPDSFSGNSPLGFWVSLPTIDLAAFMYFPTFPTSAQWNKEVGLERSVVTKGGWGRKLPIARLKLSKESIFRNSSVSNIFASRSQSSGNVLYCNTRQPYSQHCWNVFTSLQFYESHAIHVEKLAHVG